MRQRLRGSPLGMLDIERLYRALRVMDTLVELFTAENVREREISD